MAHICGEKPGSARHDALKRNVNDANNLILLCPNHHTLVDSKEQRNKYSAELLYSWKKMKELSENFKEVSDEFCSMMQRNIAEQTNVTSHIDLSDVTSESIANYTAPVINNYYYSNPGSSALPGKSDKDLKTKPHLKLSPKQDGFQISAEPIQTYASIKERLVARLFDYIVWFGMLVVSIIVGSFAPTFYTEDLAVIFLAGSLISIYENYNKGVTLGKKVFQMRVQSVGSNEVRSRTVALRNFNVYLQIFPFILVHPPSANLSGAQEILENIGVVLVVISFMITTVSIFLLVKCKSTLWDIVAKTKIVIQK